MTNSFLNLHICKSTVRLSVAQNISQLKISVEKYKTLSWLSEFYTMLCTWYWPKFGCKFKTHRIRIKTNNLETEELLFEANMKLCNMRFEKITIWEGVNQSLKSHNKRLLLKNLGERVLFKHVVVLSHGLLFYLLAIWDRFFPWDI